MYGTLSEENKFKKGRNLTLLKLVLKRVFFIFIFKIDVDEWMLVSMKETAGSIQQQRTLPELETRRCFAQLSVIDLVCLLENIFFW